MGFTVGFRYKKGPDVMPTVNIYESFLKNAEDYLISGMPELSGKFICVNDVLEDIAISSYVIRPAYNFGVDTQATNLRNYEQDGIFTFQIFKEHSANEDINLIRSTN